MNGVLRFHALRWIPINSGSVSGCEVEEFIDTTRSYHKTVWADGYTEIVSIHATHTGQNVKEPKTSSNLSVYKSPKIRYNISVKTNDKYLRGT
jgi:hypothetical protein